MPPPTTAGSLTGACVPAAAFNFVRGSTRPDWLCYLGRLKNSGVGSGSLALGADLLQAWILSAPTSVAIPIRQKTKVPLAELLFKEVWALFRFLGPGALPLVRA